MSGESSSVILQKNYFVYLKFGLLIFASLFFCFTLISFTGWFREESIIIQRFSGLLLLFFMIFIIIVEIRSRIYSESRSFEQYPPDLNQRSIDYDAVIIAHSKGFHSIGTAVGVDNLVIHFLKKQYPFRIFHCYCSSDIITILQDERAKYLWVFGHGWRGGVTFKEAGDISDFSICKPPKTEFVYQHLMMEVPRVPPKKFVGQFHCCSLSNKNQPNIPLPEILIENPKIGDYYVTDNEMNHYSVWFTTRQLLDKITRKPVKKTMDPSLK
jgi:hypothetical protein